MMWLPVSAAGLCLISCAEPPRSSLLAITPSLGYARTKRAWSKNLIARVIAGRGIKATVMCIKNPSVSAWSWTFHVTSLCAPPWGVHGHGGGSRGASWLYAVQG